MEHQTSKRQGLALGGVVQAEIADFDEALGQDMLEEATEELVRFQGAGPLALLLVVAI